MSKPLLPAAAAAAVTTAFCGKGVALGSDLKGVGAIPQNAAELLANPLALASVLAAGGIILATDLWHAVSAETAGKRAEHDHENVTRLLLSIFKDTTELRRRAPFAGVLIDQIERGELHPDQLEVDADDPAYPAIALYRAARESEQRLLALLHFTDETARAQLAFLESNHRALLKLIAASNGSVQDAVARHTVEIRADLTGILDQLAGKIDAFLNRFPPGSAEAITAARLRDHLVSASASGRDRDLAEADAEPDWEKRESLREAAAAAHTQRLSRVDHLAETFTLLESGEESSAILIEMVRIFEQQGLDSAIAYVQHRRAAILEKVSVRAEDARRELQPLLRAAQLALAEGRNAEAESLFRDLIRPHHPGWPQARHEFWHFLASTKGPRAESHGTLAEARAIYEESECHARRLTGDEPEAIRWQRDLSISHEHLGDVARAQGRLDEAVRRYADGLALAEKLVAADPGNTEWQRDLFVSHWRLADLAERGGGRVRRGSIGWPPTMRWRASTSAGSISRRRIGNI